MGGFVNKYNSILVFLFSIFGSFSLVCVDGPLSKNDMVFLNACKKGVSLDFALSLKPNIYAVDTESGRNALHYACEGGHIGTIKRILSDVKDLDERRVYLDLICAQDNEGNFPYDYAQSKGHGVVVNQLMQYVLRVAVAYDTPFFPYRLVDKLFLDACKKGVSFDILLANGASLYVVDKQTRCNGLHYVCNSGNLVGVQRILKDFNERVYSDLICAQDKQGKLPCDYAHGKRSAEITQAIMNYCLEYTMRAHVSDEKFITLVTEYIEKGADLNVSYGRRYMNPLSTACAVYQQGDIAKIRFLLDKGARADSLLQDISPIFMALVCSKDISPNERLELVSLLIDRGADYNVLGKHGLSLMHLAIILGDASMVTFLLEKNIILARQDDLGQSDFHYAIKNQHEDIVKLLLDSDVKELIVSVNKKGVSALHLAVSLPSERIAQIVLEKIKESNIDISMFIDYQGRSPLHYASEYGQPSVVTMLLDAGLSQSADNDGMTPLKLSKNNKNHGQVIQKLLSERIKKNNNLVKAGKGKKKKKKTKKYAVQISPIVSLAKTCFEEVLSSPRKKESSEDNQFELIGGSKKESEIPQLVEQESTIIHNNSGSSSPILSRKSSQSQGIQSMIVHGSSTVTVQNDCQDNDVTEDKNISISPALSLPKETVQRHISYAAVLRRDEVSLAAQTIKFGDAHGRVTGLYIPEGCVPRDISFLAGYKKSYHVREKQANISDHFHAVSDDQMNLVLKYGDHFDSKQHARVQCYRMLTTKDATSKVYTGYTEVFIKPSKSKIVHVFFNKNKKSTALVSS